MKLEFPHLEDIKTPGISPVALLGLFGEDSWLEGKTIHAHCPACGGVAHVGPLTMRCVSARCHFGTGDVVDYTAAKLGDYTLALDYLRERGTWLRDMGSAPWPQFRPQLVKSIRAYRKVVDFFFDLRTRPICAARAEVRARMRREGLDPLAMPASLHGLTKDDAKQLGGMLEGFCDAMPDLAVPATAYLFHDAHGSLAEITLLTFENRPRLINFQLRDSPIAFFGLPESTAAVQTILVQDFKTAAQLRSTRQSMQPGAVWITPIRRGAVTPAWLPRIDMMELERGCLRNFGAMVQVGRQLQLPVRHEGNRDAARPLAEALIPLICDIAETKPDVMELTAGIQTAELTPDEGTRLLHALRLRNVPGDLLEAIRSLFSNRLLFVDEDDTLFENDEGFFSRKNGKRSKETSLSNFSLRFAHNLLFHELLDIHHQATVFCGGQRFPVTLSASELRAPNDFEDAVRRALLKSGADSTYLPTLHDRRANSVLMRYLRRQSGSLPQIPGVCRLGWSGDRSKFQGPCWEVTKDETRCTEFALHHRLPSVFGTEVTLLEELPGAKIPGDACRVISRLSAFILRSYLGQECRPVAYANDTRTRALLQGLFQGLGQNRVLEMSFGLRAFSELENAPTLPLLCAGMNPAQMERVRFPVFMLQEEGQHLVGDVDPEWFGRIGLFLVVKVLEWILSGAADSFINQRAVCYAEQLELEGALAIRAAAGLSDWPQAQRRFPRFEELLTQLPADHLDALFELGDSGSSLAVEIPEGCDARQAALELMTICAFARLDGRRLVFDAVQGVPLVENYFGRVLQPRLVQ